MKSVNIGIKKRNLFLPGEQQKMEELKEGWRDAVDRVLER